MTIRIARGPRGAASPFLVFYGSTSNSASSTNTVNFVNNILAGVNATDANAVDVLDQYATLGAGTQVFDVLAAPYDEWEDLDGNSFASAADVVSYINTLASEMNDAVTTRVNPPADASDTISVTQNASFTHSVYQEGVTGYYWEPAGFPNGVSVVEGDRRRITGVITQTGSYNIAYEAGSISGITTNTLTINVL